MFSMRRHANFIKRFKSVTCLFTASVLFPMQASAAVSDYDALIIEARGGNSTPLLRYLEEQGKKSALTPNQVADWRSGRALYRKSLRTPMCVLAGS